MCNVSIIMPLHNSARFLDETVRSVQAQTFTGWELIAVDDCSTDDSAARMQGYAERDERIRLIRLTANRGAAVARNTAIEAARGRYIAFLDSDDLWLPAKLQVQLEFMQRSGAAFSYTGYEKIDEAGRPLGEVCVPARVAYRDLLKTCVIGCLTAVYDTAQLGRISMPEIRKRQDFGLWLRLLKKVDHAHGLQVPLARYRVRSDSISANKLSAAHYTWKLYREVEQLGLPASFYYFSHYALRGVVRSRLPALARACGW